MTMIVRATVTAMLAGLGASACGGGDAAEMANAGAVVEFDRSSICIVTDRDTVRMDVELAGNDEQRAHGLMDRDRLPADAGMLFTYDDVQPSEDGFWMYRTRIPLDIAFVDSTGIIAAIHAMEPCDSPDPRWCPSYPAGVPFAAALEVNRGYFADRGIDVGDRLIRVGESGCTR